MTCVCTAQQCIDKTIEHFFPITSSASFSPLVPLGDRGKPVTERAKKYTDKEQKRILRNYKKQMSLFHKVLVSVE